MEDIQLQAEQLLNTIQIQKYFSDLGEIEFVGSYVTRTLVRKDLDFFVLTENTPSLEQANYVTKQLLDSNLFQTVGFANCFDFEMKDKPKGYYWELVYRYQEDDWKFDIWYGNNEEPRLAGAVSTTKKLKEILDSNSQKRKWLMSEKEKIIQGIYPKEMKYKLYKDLIENKTP